MTILSLPRAPPILARSITLPLSPLVCVSRARPAATLHLHFRPPARNKGSSDREGREIGNRRRPKRVRETNRRNPGVINNSTPVPGGNIVLLLLLLLPPRAPPRGTAWRSKGNLIFSRKGFLEAPESQTETSSFPTPRKYLIPSPANWTVLLRDAYFRWRFYYVYRERSVFAPPSSKKKERGSERRRIARDYV